VQPRKVNSCVGRTKAPERGKLRVESWTLSEAGHGHVRQPGPPLPLVDAEGLQAPEEVVGEGTGAAISVVADEHAHAPGLPVAAHLELRELGAAGRFAQRAGHGLELPSGSGAQERQGDVEVRRRHGSPAELSELPGDERLDDVFGQAERAEEAKPCIGIDGSWRGVASVCQVCVNKRRTR
jgi:hypothetical protein